MFELLSPDARAERRLAVGLALIAGYVDAYGLLTFGTYVSFMSGNTTHAGLQTGQGKFAAVVPFGVAIVAFVAGAFAATWLAHCGLRRWRRLLYAVVALLLAVVIPLTRWGTPPATIDLAVLSLGMAMMNRTLSHVGPEHVNLTYVTGALNKIGGHLALAVTRTPLPDPQGPWDSHLRRAAILASVWAGFLMGATLSAALAGTFGVWLLLPPAAILLALALLARDGDAESRRPNNANQRAAPAVRSRLS